jgi:hypothetical protein
MFNLLVLTYTFVIDAALVNQKRKSVTVITHKYLIDTLLMSVFLNLFVDRDDLLLFNYC